MQNGEYLYSYHNDICVIKLVGCLSYAESGDFACFIDKLFEKTPPAAVAIDLSETGSLDSTNLGLIAKIARITLEQGKPKTVMISPRPDINRVLKSMGFEGVFDIVQSSDIAQKEPDKIPRMEVSEHELARTVLESHRTLMELNESNREVFKNVVQFLEREIKN